MKADHLRVTEVDLCLSSDKICGSLSNGQKGLILTDVRLARLMSISIHIWGFRPRTGEILDNRPSLFVSEEVVQPFVAPIKLLSTSSDHNCVGVDLTLLKKQFP